MKVQDESKPYDTINVTPMLDLAYVLLVIFIVMTTASVSGIKIDLPKPSNKPSLSPPKETRIVRILPDGGLMLNGASIAMTELESRLAAAVSRDREMPLMVQGDPQAQYFAVIEIIDLAGRLGIANVGLITAKIGT
jgi:biopolymer transport protein ExbD